MDTHATPPSVDDQTERRSTREIVADAFYFRDYGELYAGPRKLGHNPSWVKAVDYDTLRAELTRLRAEQEAWKVIKAGLLDNTHEAERTAERLRAELRSYEEREAACCPEDVGFDEWIAVLKAHREAFANKVDQYTALLIDLRALVEQWRQFAVDVESREECSAVMRCYNDLRARLSREPHQ